MAPASKQISTPVETFGLALHVSSQSLPGRCVACHNFILVSIQFMYQLCMGQLTNLRL